MRCRDLTEAERAELDREVAELAWRWARRLAELTGDQAPFGPMDPGVPEQRRAAAHLARMYVLTKIGASAQDRADADSFWAIQAGARYPEVAAVLGIS
jgi:hypothetical protein